MKNLKFILVIVVSIGLITLCYNIFKESCKQDDGEKQITEKIICFDMEITLNLVETDDADLEAVIENIRVMCGSLEKKLDAGVMGGELYELNRTAYNKDIHVSEELFEAVKLAKELCEDCSGAMDITIGKLYDMWEDSSKTPQTSEIQVYTNMNGYRMLVLNEADRTVRYGDDRIKINLMGIREAYVIQKVREYLENEKICGMISSESVTVTFGSSPDGNKWSSGIADPFDSAKLYGSVKGDEFSMASVTMQSKLISPFTGYKPGRNLAGVTVICEDAYKAVVLACAAYSLTAEDALSLVESVDGAECVIIMDDGTYECTEGIGKYEFEVR